MKRREEVGPVGVKGGMVSEEDDSFDFDFDFDFENIRNMFYS